LTTLNEEDFPALYRSADTLSLRAQRSFFFALGAQLVLLVVAAALSVFNLPHVSIAYAQAAVLLGSLAFAIFLFAKRPDRNWYAGRAVAESIKTLTWRYVSRAEPFDSDDEPAMRQAFSRKLKAVVDQNRQVAQLLTMFLDGAQITAVMETMRIGSLEARRSSYAQGRIADQLNWYARKTEANRRLSEKFFLTVIAVNGVAVLCALARIGYPTAPYWPTDIFVAAAASLLTWMQAKRFGDLAASYALAAHEISLISEQAALPRDDREFSLFVADAENAFSREHTQWVARKDA
jgi:hypothetical protein